MSELLLASRYCAQCLTTHNRIVSGDRAAALVRACRDDDHHFQCHKGSAIGLNLHCRGVHEINAGQAYRFARIAGIPIRELDPDALTPHQGETK